jgi:hypothetical protein
MKFKKGDLVKHDDSSYNWADTMGPDIFEGKIIKVVGDMLHIKVTKIIEQCHVKEIGEIWTTSFKSFSNNIKKLRRKK